VHGCGRTLRELLRRREVARADRYWFVGDLVNRGPRSADVLRRVRDLGERATAVLGNHDLHFLARAAGVARPRKRDDLDDLLEASDRDELAGWLSGRRLLVAEAGRLLLHAGLLPDWDAGEAVRRAARAEAALGADPLPYLGAYRPGLPEHELPAEVDREVLRDLRVLTLLRTLDPASRPAYDYTGPLAGLPAERTAWFDAPGRATAGRARIFCGHWAALGLIDRPDLVTLDTGCAWGGDLSAYRLEDGRIERVRSLDR
jgi:bis(5'-nucleosyl)-tetraphosphatase (symmetrical)